LLHITDLRPAVAVHLALDTANDLRPRVRHQVLIDQIRTLVFLSERHKHNQSAQKGTYCDNGKTTSQTGGGVAMEGTASPTLA
jgi:hypothetical protein